MIHRLHLRPTYFKYVKYGTKRIEVRLYRDKYLKFNPGDQIDFYTDDTENEAPYTADITTIYVYPNLESLLDAYPIELFADKTVTKQGLLDIYNDLYSAEEQQKYPIIGFKIKPLE